ncbi:MAG TPA: hypothetical protein VFR41_14115 [Acidimicrobiia bacterium]|nr:hypothetical protein [Acidimicrobiia bacterium]
MALVCAAVFAALALIATAAGPVAARSGVRIVAASIEGQSLFGNTRRAPVPMKSHVDVPLSVTVENNTANSIPVRYLSVSGSVMGLKVVEFQATSHTTIAPFTTATITRPANFAALKGTVIGYIEASVSVVDESGNTVASHHYYADAKAPFWSDEGWSLLFLLAFVAVGAVDIVIRVSRRSLPRNRFVRGVVFALTVCGGAIAVVAALAIARIDLLTAPIWAPVVGIATAIGFAFGYLSPGPVTRRAREDSEERFIDLIAAEAVARASGEQSRATAGTSQSSGEFAPHRSGEFTPHSSGQFTAQHSGEFPAHQSGELAPIADEQPPAATP